MNPVPVMKLVEIIPGLPTSNETLTTTLALASAMGKTTTHSLDMPGFIANRLLMPYINEAVQALHEVKILFLDQKKHTCKKIKISQSEKFLNFSHFF
jgi:3-hydroxyacyl-CoA dehydrogenase